MSARHVRSPRSGVAADGATAVADGARIALLDVQAKPDLPVIIIIIGVSSHALSGVPTRKTSLGIPARSWARAVGPGWDAMSVDRVAGRTEPWLLVLAQAT